VGEVAIVQKLPNGNYEVRPGLILKFFDLKWENKILQQKLDDCERKHK